MVLVAVPGTVPKDAHLREPLAAHQEVALVAVARDRFGELVVEGDVEGNRVAGRERTRQIKLRDGVVVGVSIIRRDEMERASQVAEAIHRQAGDGDGAALTLGVVVCGLIIADAAAEVRL